ncbi:MAG: S41 family peptidase [Bryobacteraceae bacterium]|nr:S41 family peptidase [Bryobacteraceae bacterium]MDW8376977.1 S41 family peptidase [Bryobacterales bacterium]
MKFSIGLLCLTAFPLVVWGQLTTAQRVQDFENLASLFVRRYAPANWKIESLGINLFETAPWLERVRAAKSDVEFLDICAEYVAQLQDGHSAFRTVSNFSANLGIAVDIYDGKVLIESIDRSRYPVNNFPIQVGDELVSLDGRPTEDWIQYFLKLRGGGTLRTARRMAADAITNRSQVFYPSASLVEDTSQVVIRNAQGELQSYTLTWRKTGRELRHLSPLPEVKISRFSVNATEEEPLYLRELRNWQTWAVAKDEPLLNGEPVLTDDGQIRERRWVLGWGARAPQWVFPAAYNFQIRLGNQPQHVFYSGVFQVEGLRVGFLRIPNFAPSNTAAAVAQFNSEIDFFQANTDGLVVDVMRNTGGGCVGLEYLAKLIPSEHTGFWEQFIPTLEFVNTAWQFWQTSQQLGAPRWVTETWRFYYEALQQGYASGRVLTGAFPVCGFTEPFFTPLERRPGQASAYRKPLIVLVDEFSVSFGDMFPAMIQDNRRGLIVGMRTGGWGGLSSLWRAGFYSESSTTLTRSLVVRASALETPGLPVSPYLENVGVEPDIELDYMTRENLLTRGRPFVDAFARIIAAHIRATAR